MAQISRPCLGCGEPVYRVGKTAPIKQYHGPDCRPRCSVDGCGNPQHCNPYCSAHYTRWKRTGDPLTPKLRLPNEGACVVEWCDQPMRKREWCASHYAQWLHYGEISPWQYRHGEGAYVSTHKWLRGQLGAPADRSCADCGNPAEEWSYDHSAPDERRDPTHFDAPYSRMPEHYSPRCVPCHRRYDKGRTDKYVP